MSAFKVGDLVECVDARVNQAYGPNPLRVGELYTIRKLLPDLGFGYGVALDRDNSRRGGYAATRFRLISRPDPKLIEALKALPADLVREPA